MDKHAHDDDDDLVDWLKDHGIELAALFVTLFGAIGSSPATVPEVNTTYCVTQPVMVTQQGQPNSVRLEVGRRLTLLMRILNQKDGGIRAEELAEWQADWIQWESELSESDREAVKDYATEFRGSENFQLRPSLTRYLWSQPSYRI